MMDSITVGEGALFCSTDKIDCCVDETSTVNGNWFLPNGSKVLPATNIFEPVYSYVTWGDQTVRLNLVNNSSPKLPTGIYHCEMMDKNNVTHYLYAGIYPENEGIMTLY